VRYDAALLRDHLADHGKQVVHDRVVVRPHVGRDVTRVHLVHVECGRTADIEYREIDAAECFDGAGDHLCGGVRVFGIGGERETLTAAFSISSASVSSFSRRRAVTISLAPSSAIFRARTRPMPDEAPATRTTLSV
jgi:hypothetical protein